MGIIPILGINPSLGGKFRAPFGMSSALLKTVPHLLVPRLRDLIWQMKCWALCSGAIPVSCYPVVY